jgi:mono/diheme cytochrome c family protein
MIKASRFGLGAAFVIAIPVCALLATGCNKPDESAGGPQGPPSGGPMGGSGGGPGGGGRMGGSPGGPGGGGRMGGGGRGPVAANASGAEIFQAKCGCHGPEGKGGRAPVLTSASSKSDSELTTTIHDGKQKMPAFGSQLSDEQIKKVVAYLKQLKP